MVKKVICVSLFAAVILLLFTGCFLKKEPEPEADSKIDYSSFSEYDAKEAALAYLKEKYGEEFIITYGSTVNDGVLLSGNLWYEARVVKKSEENTEAPKEYKVCVSADGNNTILGDTVICDYYNALYDEYVTPIISKEMGDIPFVVIVDSESNLDTLNYTAEFGAKPDSAIPKNLDDEGNAFQKDDFVFDIYVSESNNNGQMSKLCKQIHNTLTKNNYYRAYVVVLNQEEFYILNSAKDKYLASRTQINTNGKKLYKVE